MKREGRTEHHHLHDGAAPCRPVGEEERRAGPIHERGQPEIDRRARTARPASRTTACRSPRAAPSPLSPGRRSTAPGGTAAVPHTPSPAVGSRQSARGSLEHPRRHATPLACSVRAGEIASAFRERSRRAAWRLVSPWRFAPGGHQERECLACWERFRRWAPPRQPPCRTGATVFGRSLRLYPGRAVCMTRPCHVHGLAGRRHDLTREPAASPLHRRPPGQRFPSVPPCVGWNWGWRPMGGRERWLPSSPRERGPGGLDAPGGRRGLRRRSRGGPGTRDGLAGRCRQASR